MATLFIIGNGFDIAHGIPSKYSDFRKYLIRNYPDALQNRDAKVDIGDFFEVPLDELSVEFLLSAMDKTLGENWGDFESELAYVTFNEKFPEPKHKEDETEEEDNSLMRDYLLHMGKIVKGVIYICSEYWQKLFQNWIREVQVPINIHNIVPKKDLRELFKRENAIFLTFNYTKTLEKIYGIKEVTHIHNRVGEKLIFGHGENSVLYGQKESPMLSASFLDDMIMSFKKDTDFPMIKNKKFFRSLTIDVTKVYSYGFSYGKVDSVYIKRIIKNISPDATWYFTKFEAKDTQSMRVKKIKLRKYGFKGKFGVYEG